MAPRSPLRIVIALDGSPASTEALEWALAQSHHDDLLHLVAVLPCEPPSAGNANVIAGIYTTDVPVLMGPGTASVWQQAFEEQQRREEEAADACLKDGAERCNAADRRCSQVKLRGPGGASGVGGALVEMCSSHSIDLLVVGSRGLGAIQRSLYGLLGLGSVSEYILHHSVVPVVIVRKSKDGKTDTGATRKICVAVEESDNCLQALQVAARLVRSNGIQDQLHIISVAHPIPFPLGDDTATLFGAAEAEEYQKERERTLSAATRVCRTFVDRAEGLGVPRSALFFKGLIPEGGASSVGASIVHYCTVNKMDVIVCGSRGLGGLSSFAMSLVGLGSVSEYLAHSALKVPVCVVKGGAGGAAAASTQPDVVTAEAEAAHAHVK